MNTLSWTKEEAKRFMVAYHMINTDQRLEGKDAVKSVFERIKTIQFDPLDVVGRNPDLVLQSRIKMYKQSYLNDLLYKERYLVDGWDKMMSIYSMYDSHNFKRIREHRTNVANGYHDFHKIGHAKDYAEHVLDQIRENGPMFSRDIDLLNTDDTRWKHGKVSSVTLDYLFISGKILVYDKQVAQKRFELTERIIELKDDKRSDEEFLKWYFLRRVSSMGLVWNKSSVSWSGLFIENKNTRSKIIQKLLQTNELTKVIIEDIDEPFYLLTKSINNNAMIQKRVSFIAPLDNIIWDRLLMKTVFDFDYSWEVYVPKAKRKYGYYVLPILYGNDFIGRIEFDHQRKNNPLIIKKIWYEPKIKKTKTLEKHINQALEEFKIYLGAKEVVWDEDAETN